MSLDLLFCLIFAFFFIIGVLRGLLHQVVSLSALISGFFAAWLTCVVSGGGPTTLIAVICAAVFIAVYVVELAFGKRLVKSLALAFSKGATDRILGGFLSLVESVIVIFIFICFFDSVGRNWLEENPSVASRWQGSRLVRISAKHNILENRLSIRRVKGLFAAMRDPEAREILRAQPAFSELTANPRYRAVRDDSRLEELLKRRNWIGALGDPRTRSLIADETFWRSFFAVRWEAALEKPQPTPTASPPLPPPIPEPTATLAPTLTPTRETPKDVSTVWLKSGSTLQGRVLRRDSEGISMEVLLDGGTMSMSIASDEIERIEAPSSAEPSAR